MFEKSAVWQKWIVIVVSVVLIILLLLWLIPAIAQIRAAGEENGRGIKEIKEAQEKAQNIGKKVDVVSQNINALEGAVAGLDERMKHENELLWARIKKNERANMRHERKYHSSQRPPLVSAPQPSIKPTQPVPLQEGLACDSGGHRGVQKVVDHELRCVWIEETLPPPVLRATPPLRAVEVPASQPVVPPRDMYDSAAMPADEKPKEEKKDSSLWKYVLGGTAIVAAVLSRKGNSNSPVAMQPVGPVNAVPVAAGAVNPGM